MDVSKLLPDRVLRQNLIDVAEDFLDALRANPELDRENLKSLYSEVMISAYICGITPEKDEIDVKTKETIENWIEPLMGIYKKEETDDGES